MSQLISPRTPACVPFEPLLPLVALGEHAAAETLAHLATCANCQSELAGYAALRVSLRRELCPQPVAIWPAPWASSPLTMEDVMNPHADERPSPSRMPLPRSRPSRSAGLWRGAVAAALLIAVSVLAVLHFAPPVPSRLATPHEPTFTPYPTYPSLPLMAVQPSLRLDGNQQLGGTLAGFARLSGVSPQVAAVRPIWDTTVSGKPIEVSAELQDPRYAADGLARISSIGFGPPGNQLPEKNLGDQTYNTADLEALIVSFLPADARYLGTKTGGNPAGGGEITGFSYNSVGLATVFAPHPDKVFLKSGAFSATPGSFFWSCAILTYQGTTWDDCVLSVGEIG